MLRIILVALTVVLFLIFSIPILGILALVGKGNSRAKQDWSLRIVRSVFRFILKLAGVTITVQGLENIPRDRAVLYVGNHRSYFDILTGYVTVPGLAGFVAKKEMAKIPLLSTWMSYVNCLFLDRVNIKEGLKTILEGIREGEVRRLHLDFPGGDPQRGGFDGPAAVSRGQLKDRGEERLSGDSCGHHRHGGGV